MSDPHARWRALAAANPGMAVYPDWRAKAARDDGTERAARARAERATARTPQAAALVRCFVEGCPGHPPGDVEACRPATPGAPQVVADGGAFAAAVVAAGQAASAPYAEMRPPRWWQRLRRPTEVIDRG